MKSNIVARKYEVTPDIRERLEKKLGNEGFVAKAPAAVVEGEKVKLGKYRDTLAGIEAAIAKL